MGDNEILYSGEGLADLVVDALGRADTFNGPMEAIHRAVTKVFNDVLGVITAEELRERYGFNPSAEEEAEMYAMSRELNLREAQIHGIALFVERANATLCYNLQSAEGLRNAALSAGKTAMDQAAKRWEEHDAQE